MCGLVGFVGNVNVKVQDAFKLMLFFDQLRGVDSTGIATLTPDGGLSMFKKAVTAADFLEYGRTEDIIKSFKYNAIIGHNRAATKGAVNSANAHPFEVGNIVLAHNGTLRKQHLLPDSKDFEVDSENIAHAINKDGIEATVKRLCGAFALSYYDGVDNTINLVRNVERPLFTAKVKGWGKTANGLVWASESWMIYVACMKAGLEVVGKIESLPVGTLMKIDISHNNILDIDDYITTKELDMYEAPPALLVNGNVAKPSDKGTPFNSFGQPYRFIITRSVTSVSGASGYLYEGNTTDGKFRITLRAPKPVDMSFIYSAKCVGYHMMGGESVLAMGDYKQQELIAGKKPTSGLVENSH